MRRYLLYNKIYLLSLFKCRQFLVSEDKKLFAVQISVFSFSLWLLTVHIFVMEMFKWGALSFKLSVLKKTHIWTPFNV